MVSTAIGASRAREVDLYVSYSAMNLLNVWANFARAYYLSCAMTTRSSSGHRVSSTVHFTTFNDAIGRAVRKFRPKAQPNTAGQWHRRDEPTWFEVNTLLTLAGDIGLSNTSQIAAALSLGSRVFSDLPTVRNFFGHRNEGTEDAACRIASFYGIPFLGRRPVEILLSRPLRRPQPLLFDWIDDIETTVDLLCH